MAINPGSDLLSDALLAANPQRAQAAAERLQKLAADPEPAPAFEAALWSQPVPAREPSKLQLPAMAAGHAGKTDNPYKQFEAAMLKSFFEMMLPEKADSVFGTGFAGEVWKSMFAQELAASTANAKITHVAHDLEQRARRAKS